jgi:hypothetical protein
MRSNILAFVFLTIFFICVSAIKTISEKSETADQILMEIVALSDTVKTDHGSISDSSVVRIEEVWKQWKTVENHSFGKDRGNLPMIADLHSLHPYFRDKVQQLIRNCKAKGIELAVVESFRTHAKQSEYYTMGRKYTRSAGGKSKHQYGLAVDLVPVIDSVAMWDNIALWRKVGIEGEKLGLRWGGRWRSPYDPAHFEWSGGLTTYQLAAGALPVIPQTLSKRYPCIDEDVQELREHWEVWEDLQLAMRRDMAKRNSIASSETP